MKQINLTERMAQAVAKNAPFDDARETMLVRVEISNNLFNIGGENTFAKLDVIMQLYYEGDQWYEVSFGDVRVKTRIERDVSIPAGRVDIVAFFWKEKHGVHLVRRVGAASRENESWNKLFCEWVSTPIIGGGPTYELAFCAFGVSNSV